MASRLVLFLLVAVLSISFHSFVVTRSLLNAYFPEEIDDWMGAFSPFHNKNRLVWFLHFHKAAGTSFTDLAWKNEEIVRHSRFYANASNDAHGHLELDFKRRLRWPLVWPNRTDETQCQFDPTLVEKEQSQLLEQELVSLQDYGITFTSTEHWFPPSRVLLQHKHRVTLVVLMREPMERLVSSFYFHKGGANRCHSRKRTCSFKEWWPAESNMHVKMLNGIPFGPLIVGSDCARQMFDVSITRNEYEKALESLETFQVVLTLESVKTEPEKVACALSQTLGWKVTSLPRENVKRQRQRKRKIPEEELEMAKADNVWDIQLYKRAREMEKDLFEKLGCD